MIKPLLLLSELLDAALGATPLAASCHVYSRWGEEHLRSADGYAEPDSEGRPSGGKRRGQIGDDFGLRPAGDLVSVEIPARLETGHRAPRQRVPDGQRVSKCPATLARVEGQPEASPGSFGWGRGLGEVVVL